MFGEFTGKSRVSVKDAAVAVLANEFPLTTNQLKTRIYRVHGLKVSYQAVHKELANLELRKVIVRHGDTYLLNVEWIRSCGAFFSQTELNYSKLKRHSLGIIKRVHNEGDMVNIEFTSLSELDDYFVNVMDNFHALAPPDTPIIMHYRHNWYPILYAKKEGEILKQDPGNQRFYCLCGSNTALDNWSIKYENAIGMRVKYKKNIAEKWDLQVYGDVIVQFHLDPEVMEHIDAFFKKNNTILKYNPKELIDLMNKRGKFTVMIYRNTLLAEQLRKDTLKEFA